MSKCYEDDKYFFDKESEALKRSYTLFKKGVHEIINKPYQCWCGKWKLTRNNHIQEKYFKRVLQKAETRERREIELSSKVDKMLDYEQEIIERFKL